MPTSPFVKPDGWKINNWSPSSAVVAEGIPDDGFQPQGTLLIGVESTPAVSFTLQWLDQRGEPCSVTGLQPDPPSDLESIALVGQSLPVHFGAIEVVCNLNLSVITIGSETTLSASIVKANPLIQGIHHPDTGGGTFTATANPGGA